MLIAAFLIAGLLAALARLMLNGRIASVTTSQSQISIFMALVAGVIGGNSLYRGPGTMVGALSSVLLAGTSRTSSRSRKSVPSKSTPRSIVLVPARVTAGRRQEA